MGPEAVTISRLEGLCIPGPSIYPEFSILLSGSADTQNPMEGTVDSKQVGICAWDNLGWFSFSSMF